MTSPIASVKRHDVNLLNRVPSKLRTTTKKKKKTNTPKAFLQNFMTKKTTSETTTATTALEQTRVFVSETEVVLERARGALFPLEDERDIGIFTGEVWGKGEHLGMDVRWVLRFENEEFIDECVNPELAYVSGFDSKKDEVWETDFSGYTQTLDLDDREAALLATWIRSGYWLTRDCEEKRMLYVRHVRDGEEDGERVIAVKLRNDGLIVAHVYLCKNTHLPTKVEMKCCGSVETWKYTNWKTFNDGAFVFAETCEIIGSSGSTQRFDMSGFRSISSTSMFSSPLKRFDSELISMIKSNSNNNNSNNNNNNNNNSNNFSSRSSSNSINSISKEEISEEYGVEVVKCSSDHVLVRPFINGKDAGPFILDTGASGLVLDKRVADDLNLSTFGEVHVSGVSQKVKCAFRRANELQIGKLKIEKPVFMEMDVSHIVSGCAERVTGIIGFDAFKSSVVDVSPGKNKTVNIYPRGYFDDNASWPWQNVYIVSNVPHIKARFSGKGNHQTELRIFMIDSGAGGADVIFHGRAVETLDLENALLGKNEIRRTSTVRGVSGSGSSGGGEKCIKATLDWIEFENKGTRVEELKILLANGSGFDLSEFGCGMVCANILNSKRVVYDIPNRRICLLG